MKTLFQPIDIAALVFFRIMFGILGFADVMGLWMYYHLYKDAYNPDKFHFTYYGFEWVHPLPSILMSLFLITMLVAAILIALGKWYKQCTLFFAIGFTYMFLVEKGHYLNHGYLFSMLSWLMILLPANRAYSMDVLEGRVGARETTPYWTIFLLQFMMGVVYFYGGIAKINWDWLNGYPLLLWLEQKRNMWFIGDLLKQDWLAYFMSYGGLLLDLFIVPFLLFRKTRIWALLAALFFHIVNTIIFKIGIFPWLSISLTLLFFSPSLMRDVWAWLESKYQWTKKVGTWWQELFAHPVKKDLDYNPAAHRVIIAPLIIIFCMTNLLLPFRHHYFKGDVAWTEEGHRYSWRMMLRSKRGKGYLTVKNESTGEIKRIRSKDYLSDKQAPKMLTHPDMILQFAHHIRDEYQEKWQTDSIGVYAKIRVKLNNGKYQTYVDPERNLAKEEWYFLKESDWIVPLKEENR